MPTSFRIYILYATKTSNDILIIIFFLGKQSESFEYRNFRVKKELLRKKGFRFNQSFIEGPTS